MGLGEAYIVGLDSGTQSAKACVWDLAGRPVSRAKRPLAVRNPREGWAEQDPEEWWESARGVLSEAVSGLDPSRIRALGVAFQRETFTLFDKAGRPLRPGILWLDIRAREEVREIAASLGARAFHEATGKPLDVTSALARMLWIRKNEPDALRAAARWVDVGAFLMERLTGSFTTCVAGADTCGLIGLKTRKWDHALIDPAGLPPSAFPALAEPGQVVGRITPRAAEQCGLPAGLPVVAAGGDGQVLSVGLGEGAARGFSLTLGTSVVLGLPRGDAPISGLYRTLISADSRSRLLLESVIQSGTFLLRWFVDRFHGSEEDIRAIPPGCDGLVTMPHWWGVRFPESAPDARGAVIGWSHTHTAAHFYRSLLEGIAFELARLSKEYERLFDDIAGAGITACGGGARSQEWLRILADVLGRTVSIPREQESTALGAAMLAGLGIGEFKSIEEAAGFMSRILRSFLPDTRMNARYKEIFEKIYLPLVSASLPLTSELSRLAGAS